MDAFWSNLVSNLIAGLIVLVVGALFERWFKLTEKVYPKSVQDGKNEQSSSISGLFVIGNHVGQHAELTQGKDMVTLGTKEDALRSPTVTSENYELSGDALFLLVSLQGLLTDDGKKLSLENDYKKAIELNNGGVTRSAATTYCRVFNPIIQVMEVKNTDINKQTVTALRKEVLKIEKWSSYGSFSESLPTIIANVEKILHGYFRSCP